MKNKIFLLGVTILILSFVFVGCGDDNNGNGDGCPLSGTTWYCVEIDDTITFNTDGENFTSTGKAFGYTSGTYVLNGSTIFFKDYITATLSGNSFTLTQGSHVFVKQ